MIKGCLKGLFPEKIKSHSQFCEYLKEFKIGFSGVESDILFLTTCTSSTKIAEVQVVMNEKKQL